MPTRGKSDTVVNSASKKVPPFKGIFDRYKNPAQRKMASRLLHTYLQDAKSSLRLDTRLAYLDPSRIKKPNMLSVEEIERLLKDEKIDPSLALLLKSADKLNIGAMEQTLPSNISASGSTSLSNSVWSVSDTVLPIRPPERFIGDHRQMKDTDSSDSNSVHHQPYGNVPQAGRIVTDKGTYSAIGISSRSNIPTAKPSLSLLSAAEDMINKVGMFVDNPRVVRIRGCHPMLGIPKTPVYLSNASVFQPQSPVVEHGPEIINDTSIQRPVSGKFDPAQPVKRDSALPSKFDSTLPSKFDSTLPSKYDSELPSKIEKTHSQPQYTDYKDEMEKFKLDIKKPSLLSKQIDPAIQNFIFHKNSKGEKDFFLKKKSFGKSFPVLHAPEMTVKQHIVNEEYQDMLIRGKELPPHFSINTHASEKIEEQLKKPEQSYEDDQIADILDDEIACAELLESIWDAYERENQISDETPTMDLESFIKNAQKVFEDYFDGVKDNTGQLMKYVTFSLKDQDKISLTQAKLLMKEALVDPQMANLLMTGKKDDLVTKLKLSNLAIKLKGEDARPFDFSEIAKIDGLGDEEGQSKGAETADGKSSLDTDADGSKAGEVSVDGKSVDGKSVEGKEDEKVTVTDGTAAVPKDMTAEKLALKEASEAEKIKMPDSSVAGRGSEDAVSTTGRSDVESSLDITSMGDVLKKEAEMSAEKALSKELTSDVDSALSKTGVTVPDTVGSVDSESTAVTMVYDNISAAGTTKDGDTLSKEDLPIASTDKLSTGSTEGQPTVSTDGVSTISTDGLVAVSTEGIPATSNEGLPVISDEGLPTASREGLPTISIGKDTSGAPAEVLPTDSAEGAPPASKEKLRTTSTDDVASVPTEGGLSASVSGSASKFAVPSEEHSKKDSLATDRSQVSLPQSGRSLSREEVVKVDALIARYDSPTPSLDDDDAKSGVSTISSAYSAMNTSGSLMKISESPSEAKESAKGIGSAESAFKRAHQVSQQLSQRYGLDESPIQETRAPPSVGKPKRKSIVAPTEKPEKPKKRKSIAKPLPGIGSGKQMESLETPDKLDKKSFVADKAPLPDIGSTKKTESFPSKSQETFQSKSAAPLESYESKLPKKPSTHQSMDIAPPVEKPVKQEKPKKPEKPEKPKKSKEADKKRDKTKSPEEEELASLFKDKDEKDRFLEMGLEKILNMAKEHMQQKMKQVDSNKKQFRDPIEVRDILHARREQLHSLIMGMSDDKGIDVNAISQNELFEELETFEDEEINETLSMLTKVLHLEIVEPTSKPKLDGQEPPKKVERKSKDLDTLIIDDEDEEIEMGDKENVDKRGKRIQAKSGAMEPYKVLGKLVLGRPVLGDSLQESNEKVLDEQLFHIALLKMKTLNIFNAIKSLGITNPQMKDFDDYIAQNRLDETMDMVEIGHLRTAASEMFSFKGKAKKGRKKSVKNIKPKTLKKMGALSETQILPKPEEVCPPVDLERIEKRNILGSMKSELDMLSFEQRFTEPYAFSYYIVWPDGPKPQKTPNNKKK